MVDRDEHEAGVVERLRLQRDQSLVAGLPAAAVDPEDDRPSLGAGGRVDVEHLTLVRRGVGMSRVTLLGVRRGHTRDSEQGAEAGCASRASHVSEGRRVFGVST